MSAVAEVLAAYVIGTVVAVGLWFGAHGIFEREVFQRDNYRGHRLPTGVGLLLPLVAGIVVGAHVAVFDLWRTAFGPPANGWNAIVDGGQLVVVIAVAFGFLGFVDDIGGVGESGGFRGHLRALAEGRLTTGLLKLVGGPLFALAILGGGPPAGRLGHLRDAALICLAANLANLFDRAPGRVNKVSQLAFVVLLVSTRSTRLAPVAVVIGGAAALLGRDLREELMLGDAGSNVVGAVLGLGVVLTTTETQRWVIVAVLVALNALSEVVSFSRVIESVPPLRTLDRLGARNRPA